MKVMQNITENVFIYGRQDPLLGKNVLIKNTWKSFVNFKTKIML